MIKTKDNVFIRNFWNYFEFILIFVLSGIITLLIRNYYLDSFLNLYFNSDLKLVMVELLGGLLGLLLTAYAIVFGIAPSLNKELLESGTFLRINLLFFLSILLIITNLIISIILVFFANKIILLVHTFLFSSIVFIILGEAIILFLLFKGQRNNLIKEN